ncbi:MAG: gluconeogenesis factor YvcK family protein [Eubacteriales bacterium]
MDYISPSQWEKGPKIVTIGGGTGLSTMLRGLKRYTKNLTAIVTVADDGGGSGVLRREIGMPPPGDIRHCMEAMANVEPIMEELLTYRFSEGGLSGQSFGNLLLAALNGITGSFEEAVAQMSHVLAISGKILPVTSADVQLEAVFENGTKVIGESQISSFKKEQDCFISHVNLIPDRPMATKSALTAIAKADLIILGPGSLYTSIIPNLLVEGISEAVCNSSGITMYVCNIMTQEGETEGCTAGDHIEALLTHGMPDMLDICLANSAPVDEKLIEQYEAEDASPLVIDKERIRSLGIHLEERPVGRMTGDYARHDSDKLASAIYHIYQERAVRIFRGDHRYVLEE